VFENSSGRLFLLLFLVLFLDFLRKRRRKRMTTAPGVFQTRSEALAKAAVVMRDYRRDEFHETPF
jgi:hypothetical protein